MDPELLRTVTDIGLQGASIIAVYALWRELRAMRLEQREDWMRWNTQLSDLFARMDEHEIRAEARARVRGGTGPDNV